MDTVASNFNNITPLLFLYILSLIHQKNSNFSSADLFSSNIAYFIGKTLGTFLTNILINWAGFKLLLLSSGLSYLIAIEILRKTSSMFFMVISKGLQGIGFSLIYDLNNIFLAQKYKNGIFFARYLHITRLIINIVLIGVFSIYINPYDEIA